MKLFADLLIWRQWTSSTFTWRFRFAVILYNVKCSIFSKAEDDIIFIGEMRPARVIRTAGNFCWNKIFIVPRRHWCTEVYSCTAYIITVIVTWSLSTKQLFTNPFGFSLVIFRWRRSICHRFIVCQKKKNSDHIIIFICRRKKLKSLWLLPKGNLQAVKHEAQSFTRHLMSLVSDHWIHIFEVFLLFWSFWVFCDRLRESERRVNEWDEGEERE